MRRTTNDRFDLSRCRKLVGSDSSLTDTELQQLRDQLYELATVMLQAYDSVARPAILGIAKLSESERIEVEERAAIFEFEANLTREQADRLALNNHLQSKSRH